MVHIYCSKLGLSKISFMILKSMLTCVYLIKNDSKNSKIMKFKVKHKISFILVMSKLNFQHHYSSLQCHMILQKSLL